MLSVVRMPWSGDFINYKLSEFEICENVSDLLLYGNVDVIGLDLEQKCLKFWIVTESVWFVISKQGGDQNTENSNSW